MRVILLLAVAASCTPSPIWKTASDRLGANGRHLHLVDHSQVDDSQLYTFCRDERSSPWGAPRTYDAACVTLICDGDGTGCR
jgi:hypothetical protein